MYGNTAVDGTAFNLINDEIDMWNCWFSGTFGCQYVTMSTNEWEWSATNVSDMLVTGDISDALAFSSTDNVWCGNITTTTDNANIYLSCVGDRYNADGGDNQ